MLKTDKVERMELYKDPATQVFLSKFLSGEIADLEPVFDYRMGYRYPKVEAIIKDPAEVEPFLNKLYEVGILTRKLHDKIIFCPKCNSTNINVRYCCPLCKSFDIKKSSLVEHVKCGYMDVEDNFLKTDRLICPKCHEELKKLDVDFRRAGVWCTCEECRKSFDIPVAELFCRDCHGSSTFEDVVVKDVYSYSIKDEVKQEAALGLVLIAPIIELFVENGFEVEAPAFLNGKSGANHKFDLVARKGNGAQKVTVIDLTTAGRESVSEQPVIALFAKIFDVAPNCAYLIAIPKISENARRMAELYNIQVVEAENQEEVVGALKSKLLGKQ